MPKRATGATPVASQTRLVDAAAAERALGVERRTLFRWAKAGRIVSMRPGGERGKWLFDLSSVGVAAAADPGSGTVKAIYARVSARKQFSHLQTQIDALKAKYPDHIVYSDCASGLNFKRKGLLSLLQLAFERRLQVVRVAHRDRLCRFAYDLIERILNAHGAEICVEAADPNPASLERDLAEDVLAVIAVFGARLYGQRSGGSPRKRKPAVSSDSEETANGTASDGDEDA